MKDGLRNLVATVLVFCAVGLFSLALGTSGGPTGGTGGTESSNQQTPTPTATPTPSPSPSPSVTPTPVPEPEPAPTATATPQLRGRQQL